MSTNTTDSHSGEQAPKTQRPLVLIVASVWRPDPTRGAVPMADVCTATEAASYLRLACDTPEAARDAMNRLRREGIVTGFSHGKNRPLLFLREELVAAAKRLAMGPLMRPTSPRKSGKHARAQRSPAVTPQGARVVEAPR